MEWEQGVDGPSNIVLGIKISALVIGTSKI